MAVASAGPYANNLHLAPDITTPTPHHSIFTGRMLFLTSNQQCENTERTKRKTNEQKHENRRAKKIWIRDKSRVWRSRRRRLLAYLDDKVTSAEVGDSARQSRAAPDEAQEQRPLGVGELLHHLPEPLHQRRRRIDAFVRRHRLQQVQRNVRTATDLHYHYYYYYCFTPGSKDPGVKN